MFLVTSKFTCNAIFGIAIARYCNGSFNRAAHYWISLFIRLHHPKHIIALIFKYKTWLSSLGGDLSHSSSYSIMRLKMAMMGTKLGHYFDCPWLHQHSATMLGHLTQFRYLTSNPVYQAQALTLVRVFQRAFQFAAVPTPTETTLKQNHRSTDSGLFYASSQVTSLKLSTPPYPRENNNKLKTMRPLRVSLFGERIGVASHKGGQGSFGEGMGAILGSTWHEIE